MSEIHFNEFNPTGPRAQVSKSDRAKIDAFIQAKGVTVCPPCTYTFDLTDAMSWREVHNREAAAKFRATVSREKRAARAAARAQAEGDE